MRNYTVSNHIKKDLSFSGALFLLLAGLFIGTVCTFGTAHWFGAVTPEECIEVEAHFSGCSITLKNRYYVNCSDGSSYDVRYTHRDDNVKEKLSQLTEGESIRLLLHPGSDIVLSLTTETDTVVSFEKATGMMRKDFIFFISVGVFMYIGAILALIDVIRYIKKWTRKHNSLSKK